LYPTTLLDVLAFHARATLCCGGGVPEPLRDCTVGELEALLANVTFADAVPEAWGANVTWNETLFPAAIVTGREIPLTENSDPFTPTDDTVTGALLALSVPA